MGSLSRKFKRSNSKKEEKFSFSPEARLLQERVKLNYIDSLYKREIDQIRENIHFMETHNDLLSLHAILEANQGLSKLVKVNLSEIPANERLLYFVNHPEALDIIFAKFEEDKAKGDMPLLPDSHFEQINSPKLNTVAAKYYQGLMNIKK